MPEGYATHRELVSRVMKDAESHCGEVQEALREAFSQHIQTKNVEVIVFAEVTAEELAHAFLGYPLILKPILASTNVAARAIERDLNIKNLDTYSPRLTAETAALIAGYVKPFLPTYIELPALCHIDRVWFVDKEIRKGKGRWEVAVLSALRRLSGLAFKKTKFVADGQKFEFDAAHVVDRRILIGIDIKRVEARRDIHKRTDEIVNKANKLKSVHEEAKFGVVFYYPFPHEHINVQNRLRSPNIDGIVFASEAEESIESAIRFLLPSLAQGEK